MQLKLYNNISDSRYCKKNLTLLHTLGSSSSIRLKDRVDVINPVFIISPFIGGGDIAETVEYMSKVNYVYCDQLDRYYYCKPIFNKNVVELECHVDVLETYRADIKASEQWITRQESKGRSNKYIPDKLIHMQAEQEFHSKQFGTAFDPNSNLFIVQLAEGQEVL